MTYQRFTCIIIDDEPDGREVLEILISKLPNLSILQTFNNALDGLRFVNDFQPDIIFLDINMPETNGIEFVQLLGSKKLNIIFTTAYRNHATEAFEYNAVDYLLKPIALEKLVRAVERAIARMHPASTDGIFLKKERDHLVWIDFSDITYLEADGNYVKVHRKITFDFLHIRTTLNELVKVLPPTNFVQVNRSTVVPVSEIMELKGGTITLSNGKELNITPTYKENLNLKIRERTIR